MSTVERNIEIKAGPELLLERKARNDRLQVYRVTLTMMQVATIMEHLQTDP